MLGKETRKKLTEQNWIDFIKQDSNPSQAWHRIRVKAHRALDDLTLLARKLPDDKQQEIFDNKIRDLFSAILGTPDDYISRTWNIPNLQSPATDYRRTRLVAVLVNVALNWCIFQHRSLFTETPEQSKLTIEQLERSKKICDELAYKLHMTKLEDDAREENLFYLFEWHKIKGEHKGRFQEFLRRITESIDVNIDNFEQFTNDTITCNFSIDGFDAGTVSMKRNDANTSVTLSIISHYMKEPLREKVFNLQLLIKNEETIHWPYNELRLYIRDNHSAKKEISSYERDCLCSAETIRKIFNLNIDELPSD